MLAKKPEVPPRKGWSHIADSIFYQSEKYRSVSAINVTGVQDLKIKAVIHITKVF
jgi:hypothetical protein